jgi:hypothetical protein
VTPLPQHRVCRGGQRERALLLRFQHSVVDGRTAAIETEDCVASAAAGITWPRSHVSLAKAALAAVLPHDAVDVLVRDGAVQIGEVAVECCGGGQTAVVKDFGLNKGDPVIPVSLFLGARSSRRPSAMKREVGGRGGKRRRQDLGPAQGRGLGRVEGRVRGDKHRTQVADPPGAQSGAASNHGGGGDRDRVSREAA